MRCNYLKKNISWLQAGETRLVLDLRQSSDQLVKKASIKIGTRKLWKAEDCVNNATLRLKH